MGQKRKLILQEEPPPSHRSPVGQVHVPHVPLGEWSPNPRAVSGVTKAQSILLSMRPPDGCVAAGQLGTSLPQGPTSSGPPAGRASAVSEGGEAFPAFPRC